MDEQTGGSQRPSRRKLLGGAALIGGTAWATPRVFSAPAGAHPGTACPLHPDLLGSNGANTGGNTATSLGVTNWSVSPGIVIAAIAMRANPGTVIPPANPSPPPTSLWTQLAFTTTPNIPGPPAVPGMTLVVLYRLIAAATTISPTFTITSSRAALSLANYGPTTALAPTAATIGTEATSATVTGPSVTAAACSRAVTAMGWRAGTNTLGAPLTPTGAAVNRFDVTTAGPNGAGVGLVSQFRTLAGASGTTTATLSASAVNRALTFTIPT